MSKAQEEKRMYDSLKLVAKRKREEQIDRDTHDHDLTYENEQSMVTIPLMDAILKFCEENDIDPSSVGSLINKSLKEKIQLEAEKLNLIEKSSTATLPL